jgi:hypothetical protein
MGGLGNNLFQIAAAYALAARNKDEFFLPPWKYSSFFGEMKQYNGGATGRYAQEGFHYEPIPYAPNTLISGYFQSEKFFIDYAEHIKNLLYPRCNKSFPFLNKVTCSIHVRRGDYCDSPDLFNTQNLHYYDYCIAQLKNVYKDIDFLIFSNDMNWCKYAFANTPQYAGIPINTTNFVFIEGNTDIEDLYWMCQCTHNIIASSTFSWWGAWLNKNPNKIVYSPSCESWLGPALAHLNTKDLIPDSWKKVHQKIFDENYYITKYPDIAHAINVGAYRLGYQHYAQYGYSEGRLANWL